MNETGKKIVLFGVVLIISLVAPWLLPAYQTQLAFLWVMVVFALTWDIIIIRMYLHIKLRNEI